VSPARNLPDHSRGTATTGYSDDSPRDTATRFAAAEHVKSIAVADILASDQLRAGLQFVPGRYPDGDGLYLIGSPPVANSPPGAPLKGTATSEEVHPPQKLPGLLNH
jgi:hypothetical protein